MAFKGEQGDWSKRTMFGAEGGKVYCERRCNGCGAPLMRKPYYDGRGQNVGWEPGYFGCTCEDPNAVAPADAVPYEGFSCGCTACILGIANGIVEE